MIPIDIKFKDYDGNDREETFLFHLNKGELIDMQMSEYGGLDKLLQKIIDTKDQVKLWKYFRDIILASYGEKTGDGRNFIKKDPNGNKLVENFITTEAYGEFMMKLIQDADYASTFVNGIIPEGLDAAGNEITTGEKLPNLAPVN